MAMRYTVIWMLAGGLLLSGCSGGGSSETSLQTSTGSRAASPHQVELVAQGMQFTGPDRIPAGWTTFRFRNASTMTHFAVVERLPMHVKRSEYEAVGRLFQHAMDYINAGEPQQGMKLLEQLPPWFTQVQAQGGPGLTAPGGVSQETVYLAPGRYMIECYVKTDGIFHSYSSPAGAVATKHQPMIHELMVVASNDEGQPPPADVHVTVDEDKGITLDDAPTAGTRTFAVHFAKQSRKVMGPDVHLFRVRSEGDIAHANSWMDAMHPHGMETPAPVAFLGGTQELQTGKTAYFTAALQPGRYALIAEVADPGQHGLLATFSVAASADGNPAE